MTIWKPTADDKRTIRAVAAASERCKPGALQIEVAERASITPGSNAVSTNLLLVGGTPEDLFAGSDLHQPLPWNELDCGIELTEDGRAVVDFYVYEKVFGDHGELLTNVQAHVKVIEGKPMLWKITGTGIAPVTGSALWAFGIPEKARRHGTVAFNYIDDWRKR